MKQGHIIDNGVLKRARIIDVTCTGKYQYIKYEFTDKTYSSRIYCSEKQCDSLKKEPVIDIKLGKDDTVVIAKKRL